MLKRKSMTRYYNATILGEKGWLYEASFDVVDGQLDAIHSCTDTLSASTPDTVVDLKGKFVLPGIIDIHGDSFERCIAPRPSVYLPLQNALIENDHQLLSAGITTFFYSITDSFEEGLRSRDYVRALIEAISLTPLLCNSYIHIRHEIANTQNHDELLSWLDSHRIHLLSLNDHLPYLEEKAKLERYKNGIRRRISISENDIDALIASLQEQRNIGHVQIKALLALAQKHQIPIASHDDDTLEKVHMSMQRGVKIAEFPMNKACASAFKDAGIYTLFGAPNLIRGASHVGALSAKEAMNANVLDILCSDYHYPSLFLAPFLLVSLGLCDFKEAWDKVSLNPAKAALIDTHKGSLEKGKDADFLVLNSLEGTMESLESVYIHGCEKVHYMYEKA